MRVILLIIVFSNLLLAQLDTYEFDSRSTGAELGLISYEDGTSFTFGGNSIGYSKSLTHYDKFGSVIKSKTVQCLAKHSADLIAKAGEDNLVYTDNKYIRLVDKDFNYVSAKNFGDKIPLALISDENYIYFLSHSSSSGNDYLTFSKYDMNLTEISSTTNSTYSDYANGWGEKKLYKLDDNKFFYFYQNKLAMIFNGSFTVQNAQVEKKSNYILPLQDDKFLIQGNFYLVVADQNFDTLAVIDNELCTSQVFTYANKGNNILASFRRYYTGVMEFDISGNVVNEINTGQIYSKLHYVNGLWGSGGGSMLKTDANLNYKYLELDGQIGEVLYANDLITIAWHTNLGNTPLNIYYEDETGSQLIAENIPAEPAEFNWVVPNVKTDNAQFVIEVAEEPLKKDDFTFSIDLREQHDFIETDKILMHVWQSGIGAYNPLTGFAGFYYPDRGADHTLIYADGPLLGFMNGDSVKVHGATFWGGLMGGKILDDGTVLNEVDPTFRIYKVKKGWQNLPEGSERDAYEDAHNKWPIQDGAPWIDNNFDGIYDPAVDEPDIPEDQLLWWVSTAADYDRSAALAGSSIDKLEIRTSVYNLVNYPDVIFKKYLFINKSEDIYNDMYFSYFADSQVGYALDDYMGCDTSLGIAYLYNAVNSDEYYGSTPPAIAHMLLQGPVVEGAANDTAVFMGRVIDGKKNIGMTSSVVGLKNYNNNNFSDAPVGRYQGTVVHYNYMRGLDYDGNEIYDPITNEVVKYTLAGEPTTFSGWFEGFGWPDGPEANNRRYYISSGSFTMEPGDTNEAVIAIMAQQGSSFLNSITVLKQLATNVRTRYYDFTVGVNDQKEFTLREFILSQNYPNPFNPVTTIQFSLPASEYVELNVYNVLGEQVARLVNSELNVGTHQVRFNASLLSSGIYFYQIKAGEFTQTRKMILIK